jgi:hypothetical protein
MRTNVYSACRAAKHLLVGIFRAIVPLRIRAVRRDLLRSLRWRQRVGSRIQRNVMRLIPTLWLTVDGAAIQQTCISIAFVPI